MIRRDGGRGVAVAVRSASVVVVLGSAGLLGTSMAYAAPAARGTEQARAATTRVVDLTPAGPAPSASAVDVSAPTPAPTPTPAEPAEVTLLDVTPQAPTAADVLTLTGTVTNTSGETLTRLNTYLRMSLQPATDRDDLARMTAPGYRASFRPGPFEPLVDSLAAGDTATFQLQVPVSELQLTTAGVYPIGVEILASFEDGTRSEVGESITLVPWLPPTAGIEPRVEVAVAVPVTAAIDLAPDGSYPSEDLGEMFAPSGRLGALFGGSAAADRSAVTWLVDPALLEAAADLADGYEVRDPAAGTVAGSHPADAADWLSEVADRAAADTVRLLPYGNVDSVALVRAGLATDVMAAIAAAPLRAQAALGMADTGSGDGEGTDADPSAPATGGGTDSTATVPPSNGPSGDEVPPDLGEVTMLYPPDGAIDAPTLRVLGQAGVRNVLLASSALDAPASAGRVTVPDGAGSTVTAVPVDPALGAIFAGATSDEAPLTSVQARQRALAYTAVEALDRVGTAGAPLVVVVPSGPPAPSEAAALDVLTGAAAWVTPVPLDAAMASATTGAGTVRYSTADADEELPPAYLREVSNLRSATTTLRALTGEAESGVDLDLARLRAESAGWRDDPVSGSQLVTELRGSVDQQVGAVRIVTTGAVTLSSDSGRFPLTVANDLDRPVTVRLALTARTPARLQTSGPELVEVAAGAKTTIDVSAQATTNGVYVVDARLETADGAAFGVLTPITVRATQYDTVAWVVMGAAGTLIVIGSGVRLARRFRAARRSPA